MPVTSFMMMVMMMMMMMMMISHHVFMVAVQPQSVEHGLRSRRVQI